MAAPNYPKPPAPGAPRGLPSSARSSYATKPRVAYSRARFAPLRGKRFAPLTLFLVPTDATRRTFYAVVNRTR